MRLTDANIRMPSMQLELCSILFSIALRNILAANKIRAIGHMPRAAAVT